MNERLIIIRHLGDGVQVRHCYWYNLYDLSMTIPFDWSIQAASINNAIAKKRQVSSVDARRG